MYVCMYVCMCPVYKKFSLEQGLNLGFYNRNSNLEVILIRYWLSLRMLDYNSDKVSATLGCRRGWAVV